MKKTIGMDEFKVASSFLLYDKKLKGLSKVYSSFIDRFPYSLGLQGGEQLKSLKGFPGNLERIVKAWGGSGHRQSTLVVLGGGSLGDFGGFVASTFKRGIPLIHIPTTWLAAVDSAHGGKNGLNVGGVKNQLGTFYPASKVILNREMLFLQPKKLQKQALGEFLKMGLLDDGRLFEKMTDWNGEGSPWLWQFLKPCIQGKYDVVLKDPFEKKKIRQVLNLGHTFGHVYEAHFKKSHGESVLQGLFFALSWSRHKKIMSSRAYDSVLDPLRERWALQPAPEIGRKYKPIPYAVAKSLLFGDKKRNRNDSINFIFLKKVGRPQVKAVAVDELLDFARETKWIR